MRVTRSAVAAVLITALVGATAMAQEPAPIVRSHNPRLVMTAMLINIVYVPARLMLTGAGAILGGFAGFITFGDKAAAQAMWGLTDGSMVVTPEMLQGTEQFHFSAYD
jgi:hypothetical protein